MSNSSIWPTDKPLCGGTTSGSSEPGSNIIEGVLCIPQSSSITGVSPPDCLVSYLGQSLWEFYPSAKMQSLDSTAPANRANMATDAPTLVNSRDIDEDFYWN